MELTKHTGTGNERETEQVSAIDFDAGTVSRDNLGTWYIRMPKVIDSNNGVYESYWITFTDAEAREMKKGINYLLKYAGE
jgi:hypothetical protein